MTKNFDPATLAYFEKVAEEMKAAGSPELARVVLGKEEKPAVEVHDDAVLNLWLNRFKTSYEPLLEIKDKVRRYAYLDDPVFITGESGTGKELIAHALHADRRGDFIPVNCSGLPEYLWESEIFGHEKGSFTGADRSHEGILRAAHDGSVFLDEIGDMPKNLQAKLLRAIQDKTVRAVGSTKYLPISCRFIAATNTNYYKTIRNDLLSRLAIFIIELPPLRNRGEEDIKLLIKSFDEECELGEAQIDEIIYKSKLDHLTGNVRDIYAAVRRMIVDKHL
jgi:transcriptional regulator with PAS, ATPase and Fis domain